MEFPILTASVGTNADLFSKVADLYFQPNDKIADVTFGKGVFWQGIDTSKFTLLASDIKVGNTRIDFRSLPYKARSIEVVVLDPPYMHGGATVKDSINDCYQNENTSHESIIRLYASGMLEAERVLVKNGLLLIKCQDEIESGKQRFSHIEIAKLLDLFGFIILDLFVLVQSTIPAMREPYQKTARKNHSYLYVAQLRRL